VKRIEDIKEFKDIDTYYEISKIVDEVFQDRVEAHKHLVTANKEIERLNKIIEIKNNRIQQLMKRTRSARIDKAIEYINENGITNITCMVGQKPTKTELFKDNASLYELLEILKGSDKE
jgi:hypothetical protein